MVEKTEDFEKQVAKNSEGGSRDNLSKSVIDLLKSAINSTVESDRATKLGFPNLDLIDSSNNDRGTNRNIGHIDEVTKTTTYKSHKDGVTEESESANGIARKFKDRTDKKVEEFEYKTGKGPNGLVKTERFDDGEDTVRNTFRGREDKLQRELTKENVTVRSFEKSDNGKALRSDGKIQEITYKNGAGPYEAVQQQELFDDGRTVRTYKDHKDGLTKETVFKEAEGVTGTSRSFKGRADGKTFEVAYEGKLEEGSPRRIEHIKGEQVLTYDNGKVERIKPTK